MQLAIRELQPVAIPLYVFIRNKGKNIWSAFSVQEMIIDNLSGEELENVPIISRCASHITRVAASLSYKMKMDLV